MKTPKKKEVVKYFENAKEVECLTDKETYDISKYEFTISKFQDDWWLDTLKDCATNIHLFDDEKGYAKILSYKEPKEKRYKITREQILKYNMKDEFPEVFETKLSVGKWYKGTLLSGENPLVRIDHVDKRGNIKCYGFDNYTWFDQRGTDKHYGGINELDDWIEATEQEVTEVLTKEAVKRGLKEGVYFKTPENGYSGICSDSFIYNSEFNILYCGSNAVFNKGQWAEIIPTLTIQEAEAKLNCKII